MKTHVVRFLLAAGFVALPCLLQAQPSAHYVPGVGRHQRRLAAAAGSLCPRLQLWPTTPTRLNDASGQQCQCPADLEAFTYANVPRVIWITDTKVLGGYVGRGRAACPWFTSSLQSPGGYDHGTFGVGDFFAEGTLSWHPQQFDFAVGSRRLGADRRLSHPTGSFDARRAGLLDAHANRRGDLVY